MIVPSTPECLHRSVAFVIEKVSPLETDVKRYPLRAAGLANLRIEKKKIFSECSRDKPCGLTECQSCPIDGVLPDQ
jgi:hypothetical protein